jgi:histidyl-tRNA synthetase
MIASGSPRKRYDKAAKIKADVLVGLTMRDGNVVANLRASVQTEKFKAVEQIMQSLQS